MSRMTVRMREPMLTALLMNAQGNLEKAKMNVEIYLESPVGIGEHPDVLAAIQEQLDVIAENEERLQVLDKYFTAPHHD